MPPLLKPVECSVLILDSAGEPSELDRNVTAGRRRILHAATLCEVPCFRVGREPSHGPGEDGAPMTAGYISLQAETAPIDFRKVELLNLEGCTDPKAANYKSYLVKSNPAMCR